MWAAAALVAAATMSAFAPVLGNGFVNYDDDRALVHNPYLVEHAPGRWQWMWSTLHLGHYQPLAWMSLAFDHAVAGLNPFAFHLDSLAWHTAAAVLLFFVLVDLLRRGSRGEPSAEVSSHGRIAAAAVGALFWSVHPLRVESVAWVTERRDPISLVWLLASLLAYLKSVPEPAAARAAVARLWYVVSCACLLLSLLAKAWGLTFFVVLLVIDVYPLRRLPFGSAALTDRRYRAVWIEKVPFAVAGLAAAAVAWVAQRSLPGAMLPLAGWSPVSRVLQSAYGLCFYVAKTVWPSRLAILYELPPAASPHPVSWVLCLAAVAAAGAALVARGRRWPALAAGAVVYVVTVSPVLGLAQSGPQAVADRYAYVRAIPFSALLAAALMLAHGRASRRAFSGALLAIAALAAATWQQAGVWQDSLTLWRHAIASGHGGYVEHLDYGQALRESGALDAAIGEYRAALAVRPDSGSAWYNLANALKAAGRLADAEQAYRKAIEYLPRKIEAQVNLGNLYYNERRLPEAIAEYRAATASLAQSAPEVMAPEPFLFLGMALADAGDAAGARAQLLVARRYPSTRARAERELLRIGDR